MLGISWRLKQCSASIQASILFMAVFIIFIPISFYGAKHRSFITNNDFFMGANSLFVAGYGICWTTGVFWLHALFTGVAGDKQTRIGYIKNRTLVFLLHLMSLIAFNVWFFGSSLLERLNVAMGGHCSGLDVQSLSISACLANPDSEWMDGFDLSGHYFFIVTSCLVLIDHIFLNSGEFRAETGSSHMQNWQIISKLEKNAESIAVFTKRIVYVLVAIYIFEFCVTSIFFHTVWEKAFGLVGVPIALGIMKLCSAISKSNHNVCDSPSEASFESQEMA